MCLTFFCSEPENASRIKFILGFNREEQTLRSTLQFGAFAEDANIYGGRDMKSGGTWLGLNISTGLLVFLTNYDLPAPTVRMGRSRGKLVLSLLSTAFLPPGTTPEQADVLIETALRKIGQEGQEYSPFNLTVHNFRSAHTFYLCSEWTKDNPLLLCQSTPYGICNCDILTLWPKTAHGMDKFRHLLAQLAKLTQQQIFAQLGAIFRDKVRFSEIDDDEASIFVEPYWCKLEKAERMTKSTFLLLALQTENGITLRLQEITYHRNKPASLLQLTLPVPQQ